MKKFLNEKLIYLFLILFLISLIFPIYFLYQYNNIKIEEKEDLFLLDQNQHNLFLKNLKPKEFIDFKINPFEKKLLNEEN
ncbi:MAG: hypothetical protein PHN37_00875 [Candidatus Pacebacteria bacterium]|nr:hypothetical protein [Candidatus Paceibacterota bacterium]